MGRQQKNIVTLVVCLVLIGALAGVYFWQQSSAAAAEAEAAAQPTEETVNLQVISQSENEVVQIEYINEHGSIKLAQRGTDDDKEWYLTDYPDAPINQSTASSMTYFASTFSASSLMLETAENKAEYGLEPSAARAVATYADGHTEVVHMGSPTPDQSNYYMTVEGNPALYLITSGVGERYFYTYSDIIDRTIPTLNAEVYDYLLIAERDKPAMEFDFIGTPEERETMLTDFGALTLNMIQPYYGRELYTSSMSVHMMEGLQGLALGDLVEIDAADLSVYGLDNPSMEFWYKSGGDELHLLLGDRTEDGNIYAKLFDRQQVFLMTYDSVASMFGLDPLSVVDKFIALINIDDCESVEAEYSDSSISYELVMNHEVLPPEEGEEEGKKILHPTINGTAVDEEEFKDVYRYLIGLTTDKEGEGGRPDTEPVFTVTYNMLDGSEPVLLSFYEYNANFYTVWREGVDFVFITNKLNVDLFFNSVADMLAGE